MTNFTINIQDNYNNIKGNNQQLKILLISPYHGGSHAAWAEGFRRFSRHEITLVSLPARFWKWRMHGGAVTLSREIINMRPDVDLIFATDMLDLTTFLALTRSQLPKVRSALYMHENQLTYPLPNVRNEGPMRRQHGERDKHYAFINYVSMLASDRIFFNSNYHQDTLLAEIPKFLRNFPEFNEEGTVHDLAEKSVVLPVGIDFRRFGMPPSGKGKKDTPLIIWNQRWEYDKNPTEFFEAIYTLADEGLPFRLAICGQRFRQSPVEFEDAVSRLGSKLVHYGHANFETYSSLLWQADIVISTAVQEFFGISIAEAIYCQAFPILPRRLTYPELLPLRFRDICLYDEHAELLNRLRWALSNLSSASKIAQELSKEIRIYDWSVVAPLYDKMLSKI
jgi:glycosyltransferase involved in cell wall biosynthesis